MKILHTSDWHIGNFPGPEVDGENARFRDTCKCLDHLTATAMNEQPDIIIISGDIFHQARVWADRGLKEVQTAIHYIRLLEKVAPVCVLRGTPNHDGEEQFKALDTAFSIRSYSHSINGDDSVHIFTEPGVHKVYGYHGHKAVNIATLPGFDRGYFRAQHPGLSKEEENEAFTAALHDMIIGLKAQCDPEYPSILSTHFTVTGANTESGQTRLFAQYEPVIEPATLAAADFDLVCLGHIHRPQPIEGCRNAFYSGAINAMNFNDEEQQRGFMIHHIQHDRNVVSSFIDTPIRQFCTIRLNGEDVQHFNDGHVDTISGLCWVDKIYDKIVRVLYTCTDEANKAFNKSLLEKHLYDGGAFWVQEITPEKIDISVNRNALAADNTPEDNLCEYLEEKGIDPTRAAAYIELARPIIAEALEQTMTEKKTGTFIPVEIEVKNYRNYRDETFNYDGIRFCTINGENGAGKSSLFMDAILDALFEEPREGDLTGWISNAPEARSGAIKFTFRLGEQVYRVTRTRQKSGKATLNLAECVDGVWVDRSRERYKDTQAEIENTIGIDSLTLKACALIMQDQYGLFLQANKEARMAILGSILGLGFYSIMEEKATAAATEANRQLRKTNDAIDVINRTLPDVDELRESIGTAQEEIKRLGVETKELTGKADAERLKLNMANQAAERVAIISQEIQTITRKKTSLEANLKSQTVAAQTASDFLALEPEITVKVTEYDRLLEREKELLAVKAQYDAKQAEHTRIIGEVDAAITDKKQINTARIGIENQKAPLVKAIANERILKQKADEYDVVKARIAELEQLSTKHSLLSDKAHDAEIEYRQAKTAAETESQRRTAHIEGLKEKAALLEDSGCPMGKSASCKFLSDAISASALIPVEEAALSECMERHDKAVTEAAEKREKALEALKALKHNPAELGAKKAIIGDLEDYSRRYGLLEAHKARNADFDLQIKALDERDDAVAEKINNYSLRLEKIAAELAGMVAAVRECGDVRVKIPILSYWRNKEKELPAARERKAAAEARATELVSEIEGCAADISNKEAELKKEQAVVVEAEPVKYILFSLEEDIKAKDKLTQTLNRQVGGLKQQLEESDRAIGRIAELQELAIRQGETAAGYEVLKRAFSQDGIPHNIIRTMIPIFEATATNILGQMSGGRMSVELVTEKVLKSNSKKEVTTLDIIINDAATGSLPYMSRSGGERVKAALSVILALSEIKSTKAGVQIGFLAIDEAPFLDEQGTHAYCDALEAIQKRYSHMMVMAITHDETFKSRFPQSITVYKDETGSHIMRD